MMNEMKAAIARTQRAELTRYFNCASGGCGIKKSTIVCCEDGDEEGGMKATAIAHCCQFGGLDSLSAQS